MPPVGAAIGNRLWPAYWRTVRSPANTAAATTKPNAAAIRVLVHAAKDRGGPLKVVPGLVLADAKGKPTAQAEAVLRDGAALALTGH